MKVTTAMIADAATVEASGKLYVHGGGWTDIFAAEVPVVHPVMTLVLTVEVPWEDVLEDIAFHAELVDEDEQPVGVNVEGKMNVGPMPGRKKGDPVYVSVAVPLANVQLSHFGGYKFRVSFADREMASVRFKLNPRPGSV